MRNVEVSVIYHLGQQFKEGEFCALLNLREPFTGHIFISYSVITVKTHSE